MKNQTNTEQLRAAAELKVRQRREDKASRDIERAQLLLDAENEGVNIVHIYDQEWPRGGLTIAFSKPLRNHRMIEVAVQTCSGEDTFSRKIGTYGALTKYFNGETIKLPILESYDKDNLNYAVKKAFSAFYDAVAFTNISQAFRNVY